MEAPPSSSDSPAYDYYATRLAIRTQHKGNCQDRERSRRRAGAKLSGKFRLQAEIKPGGQL